MKKTITILALAFGISLNAQPVVADFETLTLAPNSAYSSTNSVPFQTSNAIIPFKWDTAFGGYWAGGFSYTNKYDSATAGFTNLYGVKPLKGYNNSNIYVVAKDRGVITLKAPYDTFDGFYITNTTYAYKAIKNGDNFCRKFGDTTGAGTGTTVAQGSYPDYFKVTVKGYYNGTMKTDSSVFFLADFRFTNNSLDYIVNNWQYVNTTNLGQVDSVKFFMYSTDQGLYGINTPLFFGIDNLSSSDNFVGIEENNLSYNLSVYPNPFSSVLNIDIPGNENGNTEVKVFDLLGKSVYTENFSGLSHSLNLSGLEKGIYFVEINNGKNKVIKKLIKE